MSDNNTWPDPARPGVPLNPERDGWHWLEETIAIAIRRYIGPCLTPAEVDARVSQARRDAREQVARYHDLMAKMAGSSTELQRRSLWVHSESAQDIRSGRDIRVLGEKE